MRTAIFTAALTGSIHTPSMSPHLPITARQLIDEILAVHESLDRLSTVNESAAKIVKLRYFAGMTIPEAADVLAISPRKADQLWAYARTWLMRDMGDPVAD